MKPYNLIFVKHPGVNRTFLFEAPIGVTINSGQKLKLDTKNGESWGVASGSSFYVDEYAARIITKNMGGYWPLAKVTGYIQVVAREEAVLFPQFEHDALPF